jgi:hypothetical protein
MFYDNEQFYPEEILEDYQIEIDKIIKNQLSIKHAELLAEVERQKERNEKLSNKLTEALNQIAKVERKEKDLQREKESLEYDIKKGNLTNLLSPFLSDCFGFDYEIVRQPKCDKCDENRKLEFKSPFSSKSVLSFCECTNTSKRYFIKKYTMFDFRLEKYEGDEAVLTVNICTKYEDSNYLRFNNLLRDKFEFENVPKPYYEINVLFTSETEAQKYCDYLNLPEKIPVGSIPYKPIAKLDKKAVSNA